MITEEEIQEIGRKVLTKSLVSKEGFDFNVPRDYAEQFEKDASQSGLEVLEIGSGLEEGSEVTFGIYRDHYSMVERERER